MESKETQFLNPENIIKQIDLQQGMQVGDLGCGTGYMSFVASRVVGEKGKVYAVDVQKTVLDQIKKEAQVENLTNIQIIWSDLETNVSADIANQSLDVVFLVNTLFLVKDKKVVITKAKKLLNKTGRLLVVDWKQGNTNIGPKQDQRISLANIRQILQEQGFQEEKEINAGQYHFGMLLKI